MLTALGNRFHVEDMNFNVLTNFDQLVGDYLNKILKLLSNMLPHVMQTTGSIFSFLATTLISVILSIYILVGKDDLLNKCRKFIFAYCSD